MKNKKAIIAILVVILLFLILNRVYAYFAIFATAAGKTEIDCGNNEEPKVDIKIENNKIYIKVQNRGKGAGYLRLAIYNTPKLVQLDENSLKKWEIGEGGYYYYKKVVNAGEETEELILNYNTNNVENPNVVVISEMVGAMYSDDGSSYAEWSNPIEIIE